MEEIHGEASRQEPSPSPEVPTAGDDKTHAQLFGEPENFFGGIALPVVRARYGSAHLLDLLTFSSSRVKAASLFCWRMRSFLSLA
jgi:hypothetical protein